MCHRIAKKNEIVIVKFSTRKDYIRELLVSNGSVKVRVSESSAPKSITHVDDFTKYFPDIDLSLSAQSG